jgi:hypothetical protein
MRMSPFCLSRFTAILCLLAPWAGFAQSIPAMTTITNPHPGVIAAFGRYVAAFGSDRVLIGAPDAYATEEVVPGAAYLYSIGGALLTTFTNPNPAQWSEGKFGASLAAVGGDRVLIGAPRDNTGAWEAGAVHLFSTNGTLLTTFTNPVPHSEAEFGRSVAAVGSDRVLIGAPYSEVAYLFSTQGALLTIFALPPGPPSHLDETLFGFSVAAMGSDCMLIGAPHREAAYLFSTNGTLLATMANPTPPATWTDGFGWSVAQMGSDRVLIGAPFGGEAFLFNTNGTLLKTFRPEISYFGVSVAAVGDKVLIGAGTVGAGAAYLYNTNGMLLATFNSPVGDTEFSHSVAVVGGGRVLVGSSLDKAFLFGIESYAPSLSLTQSGGSVAVSWPRAAEGFVLEETLALASTPAATIWSQVSAAIYQTNATSIFITQPAPGNKFYRLRKP